MTKLKELYIGKNKITKLQNLDKLENLEILSIQSNRILVIENLEKLSKLEQLYISHNGLEKIEGLSSNKELTTIDLAGNRIKLIENLDGLPKLEEFWVRFYLNIVNKQMPYGMRCAGNKIFIMCYCSLTTIFWMTGIKLIIYDMPLLKRSILKEIQSGRMETIPTTVVELSWLYQV